MYENTCPELLNAYVLPYSRDVSEKLIIYYLSGCAILYENDCDYRYDDLILRCVVFAI